MGFRKYKSSMLSNVLPNILLACMLACVLTVRAEAPLSSSNSLDTGTEKKVRREVYGGVIVNQTVTVGGQDFYQYFVTAWRHRDMSERFAISIHERPSARWGSQVWVEYAQRRIFQVQLPNKRDGIKALSEYAVDVVHQKLADAEVERMLFKEADLGADEF